jgi:hypothetical protein
VLAMRRVLVVALSLAILLLASIPASAKERHDFVSPQVALDWNLNAVNAVRGFSRSTGVIKLFQVEGLIYMSYTQAAVYDAVMKISGRYVPYHPFSANAEGASADAAVVAAAYRTLVHYLGNVVLDASTTPTLTDKYNAAIAALPMAGKAEGIAVGEAAAADIIVLRANDGRDGVGTNCPYTAPATFGPGDWQIVPPATFAQTPWVACFTPFLLRNAAQFRIAPPPALDSKLYAKDFNEVKTYGAVNSTVRTADQTATAYFWNAFAVNEYNDALRGTATRHNMDLVDTVRLLAMGDLVVTDSGIACFDSKYHYLFWRPTTAIHGAATDGNPATQPDASWAALINVPNHPEYPSAHGCLTSAFVNTVAKDLHTKRIEIDMKGATNGSTTLDVTRHFATVNDATNQVVDARVWIGFHYRFSTVAGVDLGASVAKWAMKRYFRPATGDDNNNDDENDD